MDDDYEGDAFRMMLRRKRSWIKRKEINSHYLMSAT